MIHWSLKILAVALVCASSAQAQLATSLRLTKKNYLAGEPVMATVTITNHAGRELIFQSDGRFQWLGFAIKNSNGNPINPRGNAHFGSMKIGAGQSLAREVDLSRHFQLSKPGNFSVAAIIHLPGGSNDASSTNRVFFNQNPGRLFWSQKVGIAGSSTNTREYRILNFTGDSKSHIYAQILNSRTGQFVRTFRLGEILTLRKPLATVDRNQRMHVLFLATPTLWVHCVINTDGKLIERDLHRRGSHGDPKLLTFGDGTVRIANSIPYNPKAAAEARAKIRKASDRPNIAP
jgi:hypothetical protein